jgi:nucleoside-diphosphate-sugar epimerase
MNGILVTVGNGALGRFLVARLCSNPDHNVRVVRLPPPLTPTPNLDTFPSVVQI